MHSSNAYYDLIDSLLKSRFEPFEKDRVRKPTDYREKLYETEFLFVVRHVCVRVANSDWATRWYDCLAKWRRCDTITTRSS